MDGSGHGTALQYCYFQLRGHSSALDSWPCFGAGDHSRDQTEALNVVVISCSQSAIHHDYLPRNVARVI